MFSLISCLSVLTFAPASKQTVTIILTKSHNVLLNVNDPTFKEADHTYACVQKLACTKKWKSIHTSLLTEAEASRDSFVLSMANMSFQGLPPSSFSSFAVCNCNY